MSKATFIAMITGLVMLFGGVGVSSYTVKGWEHVAFSCGITAAVLGGLTVFVMLISTEDDDNGHWA